MFTTLVFLVVLSILVLVHEAGHFFVAKKTGMTVEEFGLGFPPRLWSFRYRGTIYSVNAILFGGFVRILGEEEGQRSVEGSFARASFWSQLAVIVAGVTMNLVLAALLLMICNFGGLRVGLFDDDIARRATDHKVQIVQVLSNSPAQQAGLMPLDQIVGFSTNDSAFLQTNSPEAVQDYARRHVGGEIVAHIIRGDKTLEIPLRLRSINDQNQGVIGISLALTGVVRYPWYQSIWLGVSDTWHLFTATIHGYYGMISSFIAGESVGADIAGPIGIASLTGQAARVGFTYLLQFMAMISVNLAVLNLLPLPALDGGRAVLVIAQKIRGKALRESTERLIHALGFVFLLVLMVAVTVKDIIKLF